ncbi:hypothetical protein ACF0H5_009911 [Mactra antiquata]
MGSCTDSPIVLVIISSMYYSGSVKPKLSVNLIVKQVLEMVFNYMYFGIQCSSCGFGLVVECRMTKPENRGPISGRSRSYSSMQLRFLVLILLHRGRRTGERKWSRKCCS